MKSNLLVAQSGGPTVAINATLAGIIGAAMHSQEIGKVYGGLHGIEGILAGNIICLSDQITSDEDLNLLASTPAMALRSCRYKLPLPDISPETYRILEVLFQRLDIGYFFYIGGNDSMDTVSKLNSYFKGKGHDVTIVGCPKTIDNDLAMTDHTPGFGSAAKFVNAAICEIYNDMLVYGKPSVAVVEIMGRDAGWLTASSGLVRLTGVPAPQFIFVPEQPFNLEQFLSELPDLLKRDTTVVVAVSEGIRLQDGGYIQAENEGVDAFGHVQLAGAGRSLEEIIKRRIGCKVRSLELSLLQRAASHYASATDLDEARRVGENAVELALAGNSGVMVGITRLSNNPYQVKMEMFDVSRAANAVKHFPVEWIDPVTHALTQEAVDYFLPLVQGECCCACENGLPKYFSFDFSRNE